MTGSQAFQIKPTNNFEQSLKDLIRARYKRNPNGEALFRKMLTKKFTVLCAQGKLPGSQFEKWPSDSAIEGWELWKNYFTMPSLSGAAGEGRMIYLVHRATSTILPLWIYTHAEFEGRPPNDALAKALSGAATEAVEPLPPPATEPAE